MDNIPIMNCSVYISWHPHHKHDNNMLFKQGTIVSALVTLEWCEFTQQVNQGVHCTHTSCHYILTILVVNWAININFISEWVLYLPENKT